MRASVDSYTITMRRRKPSRTGGGAGRLLAGADRPHSLRLFPDALELAFVARRDCGVRDKERVLEVVPVRAGGPVEASGLGHLAVKHRKLVVHDGAVAPVAL